MESRHHFRIKENFRVRWAIEGTPIKGEGTALNISVTGMQIITDQIFELFDGNIFLIESIAGQTSLSQPKRAKIAWSNKILKNGVERLHCGMAFV